MGNFFNQDFQEFIVALNEKDVEYILVGGYAVILHGYHRTTGDLDIWINPTRENYQKMKSAFYAFGLPINAIAIKDFLNTASFEVFTFGRPPVSIDIMTHVKGLTFGKAFESSIINETQGFKIRLIGYQDLIEAKKSSRRYRDLNDIENLEQE